MRSLTAITFVLAWYVASLFASPAVLPSPNETAAAAWTMIINGQLGAAWAQSAYQFVIALLISGVIGVVSGLVVGNSQTLERLTGPAISAVFLTPRIALLPLMALWFSYGPRSGLALIVVFSVFDIFYSVVSGVHALSASYRELALTFNLTTAQWLRKVALPAVVPYLVSGLRLGFIYGLVGLVLGGFFLASPGIGALIYQTGAAFQTAPLYVALLSVAAAGIFIHYGLRALHRRIAPWAAAEGASGGRA